MQRSSGQEFYKISHVMGLNILYTGRKQAFVFPDYALGEDKDKMLAYMKEHIKAARKNADRHRQMEEIFQNIPKHLQKRRQ